MKALDAVLSKVHKISLGSPIRIFCVISSPWHISETRVINFNKNTPFVFTSLFADNLIQKEMILLKEEHLNKYRDNTSRFFEMKNMKVSLNGYHILNPINQKAKEVEMNMFVSFSPVNILTQIEDKIEHYFTNRDIKFSSFVLPVFTLVRDFYVNKDAFMLVDIGGEVSEIYLAKEHVLENSGSFPLGINFMIRELSLALKCSFEEARTHLSMFKDGHMDRVTLLKINPITNELKKNWLKNFELALSNISKGTSLPSCIYLLVEKDFQDFFIQLIKSETFSQQYLTNSKFKIIPFDASIFYKMVEHKKGVDFDTNLAIDAIYINRFLNKI